MENNTVQNSSFHGFGLSDSNNNTFTDNTVLNNGHYGINLKDSANNTFINNTVQDNGYIGFYLFYSEDNILTNNFVENHLEAAIFLMYSWNNTVIDNIMVNNGIRMVGDSSIGILQRSITNNLVNGKPLVYMQGQSHETVSLDAGQVILVNCSYITVRNQNISFATFGIQLHFSHHNILANNSANYNSHGFVLRSSINNTLVYNSARNNTLFGFYFMNSDNCTMSNCTTEINEGYGLNLGGSSNVISFNNFISNNEDSVLAYCRDSTNVFDYNYWSNHTSPDADADGIVDIPFTIEGGACVDLHPVTTKYMFIVEGESIKIPGYPLGAILVGILSLIIIKRKIGNKIKK